MKRLMPRAAAICETLDRIEQTLREQRCECHCADYVKGYRKAVELAPDNQASPMAESIRNAALVACLCVCVWILLDMAGVFG